MHVASPADNKTKLKMFEVIEIQPKIPRSIIIVLCSGGPMIGYDFTKNIFRVLIPHSK